MDESKSNPLLEAASQLSRQDALALLAREAVSSSGGEDLESIAAELAAETGGQLLLTAAAQGDVQRVLLLLKAGANPVIPTPSGLTVVDLAFSLPPWLQEVLAQFTQRWTARQAQIKQAKAEEREELARAALIQATEQANAAAADLARSQQTSRSDLKLWLQALGEASKRRYAAASKQIWEQSADQRARAQASMDRDEQLWQNGRQQSIAQLTFLRQRLQETLAANRVATERLLATSHSSFQSSGGVDGMAVHSTPSSLPSLSSTPTDSTEPDVPQLRQLEAQQLREHYERERQLIEAQRQLPILPSLASFQQAEEVREAAAAPPQSLPDEERLSATIQADAAAVALGTDTSSCSSRRGDDNHSLCEECEETTAVVACEACEGMRFCELCSERVHAASKRLRSHQPLSIAAVQQQPPAVPSASEPAALPTSSLTAITATKPVVGSSLKERMRKIGGAAAFNPAMMMGGGPGAESAAAQHLKNRRRGDSPEAVAELEHFKRPSAAGARRRRVKPSRLKFQQQGSDSDGDKEEDFEQGVGDTDNVEEVEGFQDGEVDDVGAAADVGDISSFDEEAQQQNQQEDLGASFESQAEAVVGSVETKEAEEEAVVLPAPLGRRKQDSPGKVLATAASPDSIAAAWADLCSLDSPTNWIVCGFENPDSNKPSRLVRRHSGSGGLPELLQHLRPEEIAYVGLLVMAVDARGGVSSKRAKLIRIDFVGARVPVSRRRLALASKEEANAALTGCTLSITAADPAEITAQRIGQSLLQCGGAHKPQAFHFGGDLSLELHEIVGGDGFHRGDAQSEIYGF